MTIYTVHPPRSRAASGADLASVALEPERFSWGAFVFGPIWLAAKGLWIELILWIALALAWILVASTGFFSVPSLILGACLLELFLGFEAYDLHRRALERRGRRAAGIVYGRDESEALARFLDRRSASADVGVATPSVVVRAPAGDDARFLDLFGGRGT